MRLALVLTLILTTSTPFGAEKIRLLSTAPKPALTAAQIADIEQRATERHKEGGNAGMQAVADFFDEYAYSYTGGRFVDHEFKFRLRTPKAIKPNKKYPLIVWFHGNGEGGEDNMRPLSHMQFAIASIGGPDAVDGFILATQTPGDNKAWEISRSRENKGDAGLTVAREIMEAVIEKFPIDENRVSAFGLSSGGAAAWRFVQREPEKFSGLVCCSAIPPDGELLTNLNVWAFCCMNDNAVPLASVQKAVDEINKEGGSAFLTEVMQNGHDSWSVALREKKVLNWLVAQKRHAVLNIPPGFEMEYRPITQTFLLFGLPFVCFLFLFFLPRRSRS